MSQFKVEKVTKVKGLTDLSAKARIGEKTETTAKRKGNSAPSTERPASNGRQTSVKKSAASVKGTSSDLTKSTARTPVSHHHVTNPPKPAARSKQGLSAAATTSSKAKNCPASQQSRTAPNSSTGVAAAKKKSPGQGVAAPPVPHSRTTAHPQKTVKEDQKKRKTELKKESSYDASDSDSEKGSRDRLNTDGDFGYETGSLDDSDVSTGELLSPSAKDEKKTILMPSQSDNSSCTYADLDLKKLPASVDEGSKEIQCPETHEIVYSELSLNDHGADDSGLYTYAGDGFRPLIVQEGVGIAAPIAIPIAAQKLNKNPTIENDSEKEKLCDSGRQMPPKYEEVKIVDGNFDRSNIKEVPSNQRTVETENDPIHIVGPKNDLYAVVQKKPKGAECSDNTTQLPRQSSPIQRPIVELGDVVPAIPGGRKDSNMYQAITGELQSMIMACDNVEFEEISSRKNSVEKKTSSADKRGPPPKPKPYAGPGVKKSDPDKAQTGKAKENQMKDTEPQEGQPLYTTVQKLPKPKKNDSVESLDQLRIPASSDDDNDNTSDGELPPPLPSRLPNLEDTLERTEQCENSFHFDKGDKVEEKPKKSGGFKLFKRKHRRQMSDGNVDLAASPAGSPVFQHRRSKSQADVMNIVENGQSHIDQSDPKALYSEIDIQPGKIEGSSDKKPPVKPYMEVDITQPPVTPTEFKETKFMGEEIEDYSEPYELPEGWREVNGDSGTYYWHVASGTTQWTLPQVAPRPKKKETEEAKSAETTERQKVLSFPVHSMGWIELEENQVAPHNMSETISDCISSLAQQRKDLWNTSDTWGEGKDIRLLLEGDVLKLAEPRTKATLLVQPVSKMRVWGIGKEDQRDFAYVARDPSTGKHKCHMFRCHGNISGRTITNALHDMCSKILEKKKKAQESNRKMSAQKPWSDIINTPPPSSARDHASFNEKPHVEPKKSFSAKYVGRIDVPKPTGVEILNKAINKLTSKGGVWKTILIEISVSNIRITDCTTQELISEDRVRFMSFFGVGKDERLCGYIVCTSPDVFLCHVFHCTPNAATLTKALAEACQLRFQKCVDAHPELMQKVTASEQEKIKEKSDKDKDKAGFMTSVQGLLGKFGQKIGGGKKEENQPDTKSSQSNIHVITCKPTHTFMVKYYGALPVAVGTGIETVEEAAKHLAGGTLLVCQLDVALNGVTLYDSQRSALSKRNLDADTISYCGLTSNRSHFGLIQTMGGGKYICHVFAEYKTKAGPIVAAIHETL